MLKLKLTRKKMIISVVVSLLLITVSVLGVMVWRGSSPNVEDNKEASSDKAEAVQLEAANYISGGDVEGGLSYYDDQINNEKDNDQKQTLLVSKSSFALMAKENDTALSAAKQADEMGSNAATQRALAEAYIASGNKEQAAEYYKKLLETQPDNGGLRRGPPLEKVIEELEQ